MGTFFFIFYCLKICTIQKKYLPLSVDKLNNKITLIMAKIIFTFVLIIATWFLLALGEDALANYILILYFGFSILGDLEDIKEKLKNK